MLTRANRLARWTIELGAFTEGPCAGGTLQGWTPTAVHHGCGDVAPGSRVSGLPDPDNRDGGPNGDQLIRSAMPRPRSPAESIRRGPCRSVLGRDRGLQPSGDRRSIRLRDVRKTRRVLTPMLVTADQVVQVVVTISFCNATGCLS